MGYTAAIINRTSEDISQKIIEDHNGLLKIEADKLAESEPKPKRIDIQSAA